MNSSAISHREESTPDWSQNTNVDYHDTMISQCTEPHSITEQNVLFQNTTETPIFPLLKPSLLMVGVELHTF